MFGRARATFGIKAAEVIYNNQESLYSVSIYLYAICGSKRGKLLPETILAFGGYIRYPQSSVYCKIFGGRT